MKREFSKRNHNVIFTFCPKRYELVGSKREKETFRKERNNHEIFSVRNVIYSLEFCKQIKFKCLMLERRFPLSRTQSDYAQLMKARRMATRQRAEAACLPCKAKKAKCSDYRPCARCSQSGHDKCMDVVAFQSVGSPYSRRRSNLEKEDYSLSLTLSTAHVFRPFRKAPCVRTFDAASGSADCFATYGYCVPTSSQLTDQVSNDTKSQQREDFCASDQHAESGSSSTVTNKMLRASFNSCVEWAWEAPAGPGNEDPFHDDWKRCQLLWVQDDMT